MIKNIPRLQKINVLDLPLGITKLLQTRDQKSKYAILTSRNLGKIIKIVRA